MEDGRKTALCLIILTTAICQLSTVVNAQFPYNPGARALGMGSACAAVSMDATSLFWNPAGLAYSQQKEIAAMYNKDFAETRNLYFGFAKPLPEAGGFGLGWYRIYNEFEKTDIYGNSFGNEEYAGDVVGAGMGWYKGLPVALGAGIKYLRERIGGFQLSGISMDAGMLYEAAPYRIAVVLQDLASTGMRGDSAASGTVNEKIPFKGTLGLAYFASREVRISAEEEDEGRDSESKQPENMSLAGCIGCDVTYTAEGKGKTELSPGAEMWVNNTVALRAGYRNMKYITAGISLKYGWARIDYAFVANPEIENRNIISTSVFL